MKNIFHNIISFLLISCILIVVFYDYPVENKVDFKKQIVEFTNFEDGRDINKVLFFFEFPLLDYWENKKINKIELKKIYLSYWERFDYSKNEIQKVEKISDYEFVLTTKYIYRRIIASKVNRYRLSETKFKFNKSGKITSITNLSIKKIDEQYIINNNLISDFSYIENVPQKNNLQLVSFFTILLILNLTVQLVGFINKRKKVSEKPNEFKVNKDRVIKKEKVNSTLGNRDSQEELRIVDIEQQKLKDERELNRLIQIEEVEKNRIRDLKEKVAAKRKLLIRLAKEKIEEEKIEAEKKEVARIKRNKIAKEKREEKKRLELVRKVNEEARIKREKIILKEREDKKRKKRKKEKQEKQEKINSNIALVDQSKDDFFDDNLSQYITEIPDDDIDEAESESDEGVFLTDKYMSQDLKNKLKNK